MRPLMTRWMAVGSVVVWTVVLLSIAANAYWVRSFSEVGPLARGCYLTDALWYYVNCTGFAFSGLVGWLLTIPYVLWLGPYGFLFSPPTAILVWFFLLFPIWYFWWKRRHA